MIVVAGEALVDLIVDASGGVTAVPGGGPYNVVRTVARLGVEAVYLGPLSRDRFGRLLRAGLDHDGVRPALPDPVPLPTTLALADLGADGSATYEFYVDGTSAPSLRPDDVPAGLLDAARALHVGTLGVVFEPTATTLAALVRAAPADLVVMVDPNARPSAVRDSVAYLEPASPPDVAARALLRRGPRVVLVTEGGDPARVVHGGGVVEVPVPAVTVVDTVGAGDSFGGAFLAWWVAHGLGREELDDVARVVAATTVAVEVAAVTCTRRGADPPTRAALGDRWSTED